MTGPEMMIKMILKSLGVNPEEVQKLMTDAVGNLSTMAGGVAANMESIQKSLAILPELNERLKRLETLVDKDGARPVLELSANGVISNDQQKSIDGDAILVERGHGAAETSRGTGSH